jgi:hypothetical protein
MLSGKLNKDSAKIGRFLSCMILYVLVWSCNLWSYQNGNTPTLPLPALPDPKDPLDTCAQEVSEPDLSMLSGHLFHQTLFFTSRGSFSLSWNAEMRCNEMQWARVNTLQYTSIILNLCFVMSVFLFCRNIFTALAMISHGGGPETRHVMRFISFDNILHVRCVISVSCLCHITDITDITVYFFHVVNQLGHQLGQSFCIASCSAPSCRGQHDAKSDGHLRLNTTNTTPGNALKLQSSPVISNPSSKPAHSLNLTRVSRSNDRFKFSWVRW